MFEMNHHHHPYSLFLPQIFEYLNIHEICSSLCLVCREWKRITNSDSLWEKKLIKNFTSHSYHQTQNIITISDLSNQMLQFVHDDSQIYLQSSYSGGSVDDDDIIMNHFMSPLILHPKKQLKFAFVCEYLFKKKTHLKFVTIHKMNTRKHGKIEVTYSYFHKKREHYNYLNHHHNYYFVLLCEYYVKLITKNMNVNAFCEEQSVNAFSENSPFKITLTPHDVIFAVYIPSMQSICYCYIQTQSKICIYLMASDVYPYQCVIPLLFQIYTECYENVEGVLMDRVVDLDQRIKVLFEAFDLRKTVPQSSKENGEFTIQALQHYDPITFDEMHVVNIADILS